MNKGQLAAAMAVVSCSLAVGLTVWNVRREAFPPLTTPNGRVSDWRLYASHGHLIGPADADVTLVVFSDYQCPFCRELAIRLSQLRTTMSPEIKMAVIWRHFPMTGHEFARPAARAAVCAAEQGRFEEFHMTLFEHPERLSAWWAAAQDAGVQDSALFASCLTSETPDTVVARDVAAAQRLGIRGTPTVIINGRVYTGIPSNLQRIIRRESRDE